MRSGFPFVTKPPRIRDKKSGFFCKKLSRLPEWLQKMPERWREKTKSGPISVFYKEKISGKYPRKN